MLKSVPFEYPTRFLADVLAGDVIRYGTILKDAGTGKIIGHMQESGVAQSLLSMMGSGVTSPLSLAANIVNVGSGIYTAVQVNQLKAMVETLQSLQIATLGVSLVGLGVSAASFLYMRKRFSLIDKKLEEISTAIETGFENQHKAAIRKQMSRTKSLIQRAEQAQALSDPRSEYAEIAGGLTEHAAYFEGEVTFLISAKGKINRELFWQLAQMLMLCNNIRIDCQLRRNELRHALTISETIAQEYQTLFDPLTPVSFDMPLDDGINEIRVLRDITDAAACKPYLIDHLYTKRIDGRDYITSLESEKESPLLVMKVS